MSHDKDIGVPSWADQKIRMSTQRVFRNLTFLLNLTVKISESLFFFVLTCFLEKVSGICQYETVEKNLIKE